MLSSKITFYFNMFGKHKKVNSILSLLVLSHPSTGTCLLFYPVSIFCHFVANDFLCFSLCNLPLAWRARKEIYIIKLFAHIHIFVYIHMLAIAGQTAGPNWLNKKIYFFLFDFFLFHGQRRALQLVTSKYLSFEPGWKIV